MINARIEQRFVEEQQRFRSRSSPDASGHHSSLLDDMGIWGDERRKRTRSGGGASEERGGERRGLVGRHARDSVGPSSPIGLAPVLSLSPAGCTPSPEGASAR